MKAVIAISVCAWLAGAAGYFAADDKKSPPVQQSKVTDSRPIDAKAPKQAPDKMTDDLEAALERPAVLEFHETPLSQVILFLAAQHHVRVFVDESGLAEAMVDRETPVTMQMSGVRLGLALDLILEPMNLDCAIRENVLFVSSRERVAGFRDAMVIRVGDILRPGENAAESAEQLITLITDAINPEGWNTNGGENTIQFVTDARSFVVTAPGRTQRKVAKLLNELRSAKVAQGLPSTSTTAPIAAR